MLGILQMSKYKYIRKHVSLGCVFNVWSGLKCIVRVCSGIKYYNINLNLQT